MAISRDNPQTAASVTNGTSQTLSYTVNSGSDRVLVVVGHLQRNDSAGFTASCTWDGNAMTEAVTETVSFSTTRRWRTYIWYYIAPTVKTANIVMTAGASIHSFAISAVTLRGAHQTTPLGITDTDTTTQANSLVLNGCTAGSMILAGVTTNSAGAPTWTWTTATEAHDANNGDVTTELAYSDGYYANSSAGNVTLTATRSADSQGQPGVAAEFLTSVTTNYNETITLARQMQTATSSFLPRILRYNQQSLVDTDGGTTATLSYTVSNVADRVLVVTAHAVRSVPATFTLTATWDGSAMTSAVTLQTSSEFRWFRTSIFYFIAPAVKTGDIVITASQGSMYLALGAVTLSNVAQSSPAGAWDTDVGNPTNSLALSGLTLQSMVIAAVTSDSGNTPSWSWPIATEHYDLNNGNSDFKAAGSAAWYTVETAGGATLEATRSDTALGQPGVAVEFLASALTTSETLLLARSAGTTLAHLATFKASVSVGRTVSTGTPVGSGTLLGTLALPRTVDASADELAAMRDSITAARALSAGSSGAAAFLSSLSLATSRTLTPSDAAAFVASLALGVARVMTATDAASFLASLALATTRAASPVGYAGLLDAVSLGLVRALLATEEVGLQDALLLVRALDIAQVNLLTAGEAMALARTLDAVLGTQAAIDESLLIALTRAIAQSDEVAGAVAEALTLLRSHSIEFVSVAAMLGDTGPAGLVRVMGIGISGAAALAEALAIAVSRGVNVVDVTGAIAEESITLARQIGIAPATLASILASLVLGRQATITAGDLTAMLEDVELATTRTATTGALASMLATLSLSRVQVMATDPIAEIMEALGIGIYRAVAFGDALNVIITHRHIFVVDAESRVFVVPLEQRVFSVVDEE